MSKRDPLTVFYDGGCPLCRKEIAFYRARRGAEQVAWVDLSAMQREAVAPGLSRCDALRRFHVRDEEGRLLSGARAFAALWRQLPGFRVLGALIALPGISQVAELAYRGFLKFRPRLQRVFARSSCAS